MTLHNYKLPERMDAIDYVLQAMLGFYEGDLSWFDEASCRSTYTGADVDNPFFSSGGDDDNNRTEPGRYERITKAKTMCASCPARWDCLRWSLLTEDRYAVAGGTHPTERRTTLTRWLNEQKRGNGNDEVLDELTTELWRSTEERLAKLRLSS